MNIAQALQTCIGLGLDRLDAQLLLLYSLQRSVHDRAWLLAHDTDDLPVNAWQSLELAAMRRRAGEPLAYITGHKEFHGLDLLVDKRVLVPRPDTETLVDWALEVLANQSTASVLDLGTGSGAIALALKQQRPGWQLSAVDASASALAVAQVNAQRLKLAVAFNQSHWLNNTHGQFDAIISNPPYIAKDDTHLLALTHEPLQALTSGADGLDDIRTIIFQAPAHLHSGGWLLLEHGYNQAEEVRGLLKEGRFESVQSKCDLAGIERCSGGRFWLDKGVA